MIALEVGKGNWGLIVESVQSFVDCFKVLVEPSLV